MVTYLNYRDSTYTKKDYWFSSALEPSYFQSEIGSNNTFTLKLPLRLNNGRVPPITPIPPTLPLGDYVSLADTEYGGKITSYDIDIKNKIVTYYGDSLRGLLNRWIAEPGTEDAVINIYQNNQHDTSSSTYRRSIEGYLNNRASIYGLPVQAVQVNNISSDWFTEGSSSNRYLEFIIPLGTTFLGACELFSQNTGLKYKISLTANGTYTINFTTRQSVEYNYLDDRKDLILTQTLKQNMVVDSSTMHYIADDDTYKSKIITWSGTNPPTDLKFPGLGIYSAWNPNDESNKENQNRLQALREKGAGCSITLTEDDINADIGDYLTVVARQIGIRTEPQKISGKVLTIENGRSKVEYILS